MSKLGNFPFSDFHCNECAQASSGIGAYYVDPVVESIPLGTEADMNAGLMSLYSTLAIVAAGAAAYHGYKRNDSVGWAIWWGLMGAAFPVITLPIAFAQGFDARKK
jgi:hypothetical protein